MTEQGVVPLPEQHNESETLPKYKWLLDWGWFLSMPVTRHGIRQLLFYSDGSVRFMHACRVVGDVQIVCAPLLFDHEITNRNPITDPKTLVTITPSIDCGDCGTHGFVTNGWWRDV